MVKKLFCTLVCALLCLGLTHTAEARVAKNKEQAAAALVPISCVDRYSGATMTGGSAVRIHHAPGKQWILITAHHITGYCESLGGQLQALTYKDLRDKDGHTYKRQEVAIPLEILVNDRQHDLAIVRTKRSFNKEAYYLKLSQQRLDYLQLVVTIGYPAPWAPDHGPIMAVGYINHPRAEDEVCNLKKKQNTPWIILGPMGKEKPQLDEYDGVWDCNPKIHGYEPMRMEMILYDAEQGPGNSGGALVNRRFEMVGVTVVGYYMGNRRGGSIPMKYINENVRKVEKQLGIIILK